MLLLFARQGSAEDRDLNLSRAQIPQFHCDGVATKFFSKEAGGLAASENDPQVLQELCQKHNVPLPLIHGLMRIEATPPRRGRQGVNNRSRELLERYAGRESSSLDSHQRAESFPLPDNAPSHLTLAEISLWNFCLFKDAKASFVQDPERPICIIEAQNGHGKSTFLKALRFALYGAPRSQLASYLHHYVQAPTAAMEVVLTFNGKLGPVVLRRKVEFETSSRGWEPKTQGQLTVKSTIGEESELLHEAEAEEWVDLYLPKEVMDFFCFDAENSLVNQMAEGSSEKVVASALESVLGVTSIRVVAERCSKLKREWDKEVEASETESSKEVQARLADLEARLESAENKLESLGRQKEQLLEDRQDLDYRLQDLLANFDPEAEAERQHLQEQLHHLERELQEWEEKQDELVGSVLPLQLLDALLQQTLAEAQSQRSVELSEERLKGLQAGLKAVARLAAQQKIPWHENPLPSEEQILARLNQELETPQMGSSYPACLLTEREIWALESLRKRAREAGSLAESVELAKQLRSRKSELEEKCRSGLPNHQLLMDEHGRLLKSKEDSASKLAVIEEKVSNLTRELHDLRRDQQEGNSELKSARKEDKRRKARQKKITLAKAAAKVLEEYALALRSLRVETLETQASDLFRRITNKPELYSTIRFDRKTLLYQILDFQGEPVPLSRSTGEKAVLAMSIVYGLQKASGRSLPIIVEAPLKPLDPVHTTGLLTHFFAHHPGQSILLLKPSELSATMAPTVAPRVGQRILLRRPEPDKEVSILCQEEGLT